jgi:hypothetical protein
MRAVWVGPAVLMLAAVLVGQAACRRGSRREPGPPPVAPAPTLGEVAVRDLTPPDEAPVQLDIASLKHALRARLLASGQFQPDDPADAGTRAAAGQASPAVTRVQVQIGLASVEVGTKGLARARVRVQLESRPSDAAGALDERMDATGEQPYPVAPRPRGAAGDAGGVKRRALFEGLVLRMAGDLIEGFAARRRIQQGRPEALHDALIADGGELRIEAIRAAGARQLTAEVPTLLTLLNDPDEATRDAALGALIQMRDRRAVSELTRSRSLRDRREMRKIIEAIAILGGQEADDYLSFVASSHDDEEIRSAAAAARARLKRHQVDGSN